jgi:RNA polymerase sigma-70 factor (ECF subfamily)
VPPHDLTHSKEEQELAQLMRKTQAGDQEAYTALLTKVQTLLKPFIINALGKSPQMDIVNDLIQDSMLGIHAKRSTFDPDRFFLPWMYAIARYKIIDHFRLRKNHSQITSIEAPGVWEQLSITASDQTMKNDINKLLQDLPAKQKKLFELVKLEGLSIQEASLHTGFSTSDIKVSLHRGLTFLQRQIKERSKK